MTRVLYRARSMACAPKGHSLQSLQFCSNVFWRVKQQIWYSCEVFFEPRLYSHLNTSKNGPWFWGFISSMGSFIACHIPDWWSRVQIGFDQISPSRIDNDKLYRATLRSPGDCLPGAGGMLGYYKLSDSLGSSGFEFISKMAAFRFR